MATKAKTTSTRAASARTKKTTRPVKAVRTMPKKTETTVVKTAPVAAVRPVTRQKTYQLSNDLSGAQLIGEMVGTFMLVTVATATGGNAFLIGVALFAIAAALFSISGAHVNPAVTFGLWVMRKVSAIKMLFYWMAQFVGAIAAILTVHAFAGSKVGISLANFAQWDWRIFFAEMLGAALFMFGIAAAARRGQTDHDKSWMIGLSLFAALLISGSLLQQAVTAASSKATEDTNAKEMPRITKINGTTLNPAVALSMSESAQTSMLSNQQSSDGASRLTLEVVVGTLLGAAVGGRLYMLLARNTEEGKL